MLRRRRILVLVVMLLALGGVMSGTAVSADPIPPCWNTYDLYPNVWTKGCVDVPIGEIGEVWVCSFDCDRYPICVYNPELPPSHQIGCGIV